MHVDCHRDQACWRRRLSTHPLLPFYACITVLKTIQRFDLNGYCINISIQCTQTWPAILFIDLVLSAQRATLTLAHKYINYLHTIPTYLMPELNVAVHKRTINCIISNKMKYYGFRAEEEWFWKMQNERKLRMFIMKQMLDLNVLNLKKHHAKGVYATDQIQLNRTHTSERWPANSRCTQPSSAASSED